MKLKVRVLKNLNIKNKIVSKYLSLYRDYRRYYPHRKDYTYRQLRQNIAEAASIVNATIDSKDIKRSTFIPWLDNNWEQIYYNHWYFAVIIDEVNGCPTVIIQDIHYEGDHHNDILLSKPYDEEDLEDLNNI